MTSAKRDVPGATAPLAPRYAGHPVLGNLLQRIRDPLTMCSDSQRRHGDVVRFRMGYLHVEQLTHPDAVRHVLAEGRTGYGKGPSWDKTRPLIGDSLVTLEGEEWKKQRRQVQPAFGHAALAGLVDTMAAVTAGVLDDWVSARSGTTDPMVLEVYPEMKHLTLTIVLRSLFGAQPPADRAAVAEAFTSALEITNARISSLLPYRPALYRLPTSDNRSFDRARGRVDAMVDQILSTRATAGGGEAVRPSDAARGGVGEADERVGADLLDLMIAGAQQEGSASTARQLRDQLVTLMLAGHETTATALTWVFALLERHPDVEACLADEVETVLAGRIPTAADLASLPYTGAVFSEAMRLYPPLWAIPRVATRDDVVGGFRIPKGDVVLLVPWVTHRHPDFWADPEHFDPDRFLPENKGSVHRWAYLPFGGGQRRCLGDHFALMEAQVVLAMVVQRFRLRSGTPTMVTPDPYVTLRPAGPLPMTLERVGG